MKTNKKWMVCVMSAALLFNAAMVAVPAAYASDDDEDTVYTEVVKPAFDDNRFFQDFINQLTQNVSIVANKDYGDIDDELFSGATLLQASGMAESDLIAGLQQQIQQSLDAAARSYRITEAQYNKLDTTLLSSIRESLNTPGGGKSAYPLTSTDIDALIDKHLEQLVTYAYALTDEDYTDVQDRLRQGESVVSAARVNADELTDSSTGFINQDIDSAIQSRALTAEEGNQAKLQAVAAIEQALQAPGGVIRKDKTAAAFDGEKWIDTKLQTIVRDTSYFMNDSEDAYNELTANLSGGQPIAEASGLPAEQLITDLTGLWSQDLEDALRKGELTQDQMRQLQEQTQQKIGEAISVSRG